jgi:hypothetical protein
MAKNRTRNNGASSAPLGFEAKLRATPDAPETTWTRILLEKTGELLITDYAGPLLNSC